MTSITHHISNTAPKTLNPFIYCPPYYLLLNLLLIALTMPLAAQSQLPKSDSLHLQDHYQAAPSDSSPQKTPCLAFAPKPDKKRLIGASSLAIGGYATTMIMLDKAWYAQYNRVPFHFFDDNKGWQQIDKIGHVWTAYIESFYTAQLYQWAGMPPKKAAWIGASAGFLFQAGLETLDGFSEAWGASVGDLLANTAGSVLMAAQATAWNEQRIWLKFSSHRPNYQHLPQPVQERVKQLYGTGIAEPILKDYNGQSYWLSINPMSFCKNTPKGFPKWLNLAIGYGADGMLGSEKNTWQLNDGTLYSYNEWQRYRQFYLSFDIDLTRLPIHSRFWRMALGMLNIIKIPAPALEYNTKGEFKFHALYW